MQVSTNKQAERHSAKIINLKVDDEANAFCIDSAKPRFSWQMQSAQTGQKQTGYILLVAKDATLRDIVWDSGKMDTDTSIGIVYNGNPLTPTTRYHWRVTVFDKDNTPIASSTETFETGLMDQADAWAGSDWISADTRCCMDLRDSFRYTAEGKFTCQNISVGLIFNALDQNNFYMWQMEFKADRVLLRPHRRRHGEWDAYNEAYAIDITNLLGGAQTFHTIPAKLKVDVTASQIKTYINDTLAVTLPVDQGEGIGTYLGRIGLRSNGESRGTAADLKLTDYTNNILGEVVCHYTFQTENPFSVGSIENGTFLLYGVDELIAQDPPSAYRKEFSIAAGKVLQSAKLYSTSLGVYDVFLNNQRVGQKMPNGETIYDELKPGYTQPKIRVNYFVYEVSHLIRPNKKNVIAAIVSSGWWNGMVVRREGLGRTAFRAKLVMQYTDGSRCIIGTDTSWKASLENPLSLADIYLGEHFDANRSPAWKGTDFDDTNWRNADINQEFQGIICAAPPGSKVRIRPDLTLFPKTVTLYNGIINASETQYGRINMIHTYQDGEKIQLGAEEIAIFDMGQNFAGWPMIQAESKKGTTLTLRHSEMLNDNNGCKARGNDGPEGSIYTAANRRSRSTAKYTMNGQGIESYHSTHAYYGFRYVEVSATAPIIIHKLTGQVLTAIQKDTGELTTSHEMVNQLSRNVRWGLYSNMHSIPTACPQRDEREAWTGDTQAVSATAMYYSDSKNHFSSWMTAVRDTQRSQDGAFPEIAPNHGFDFWYGVAGWADAGIIVPYNIYKMYGDPYVLKENWASMQRYMDEFMLSTNKDGGQLSFGDWLSFESNDDTIRRMIAIAYYAWDAQMMAEMAATLGKTVDAANYTQIYEVEKAYFQEKFVNPDGTLLRTEQTACLMALKMDLLPNSESKKKVKQALLYNIERNGNKLQTGFIGTAAILTTLSEIGANETAYKILLQRNNPSWLYSIDQGATTIWERWDSYTKEKGFSEVEMNSFNHFAYGAVGEWMFGYMAGILWDTRYPGFKNSILHPVPDPSLQFVKASFESPYGKIVSNWNYEGNTFIYEIIVPANTTATVRIPAAAGNQIEVNGKDASALNWSLDGAVYVETVNDRAIFHTASGTFRFSSIL